jgi:hypothetical protein
VEKAAEVRLRTFLENQMTEALLYTCYKCKKRFYKTEGCNHMVRIHTTTIRHHHLTPPFDTVFSLNGAPFDTLLLLFPDMPMRCPLMLPVWGAA